MAIAVGLIGNLKGKVGNSVFATRRGTQIVRVYQPTVANPKSRRQEYSRAKFGLAVFVAKPLARIFNIGWGKVAPTYTFQKAISMIVPADNGVITNAGNDQLGVNIPGLLATVSAPGLVPPLLGTPDLSEEGEVTVPVTLNDACFTNPNGGSEHCGVVLFLYVKAQPENGQSGSLVAVKQAEIIDPNVEQQVVIEYPQMYSGMKVQLVGFAKQIPEAVNGIATEETPWMFPADTSEPLVYGEITLT